MESCDVKILDAKYIIDNNEKMLVLFLSTVQSRWKNLGVEALFVALWGHGCRNCYFILTTNSDTGTLNMCVK